MKTKAHLWLDAWGVCVRISALCLLPCLVLSPGCAAPPTEAVVRHPQHVCVSGIWVPSPVDTWVDLYDEKADIPDYRRPECVRIPNPFPQEDIPYAFPPDTFRISRTDDEGVTGLEAIDLPPIPSGAKTVLICGQYNLKGLADNHDVEILLWTIFQPNFKESVHDFLARELPGLAHFKSLKQLYIAVLTGPDSKAKLFSDISLSWAADLKHLSRLELDIDACLFRDVERLRELPELEAVRFSSDTSRAPSFVMSFGQKEWTNVSVLDLSEVCLLDATSLAAVMSAQTVSPPAFCPLENLPKRVEHLDLTRYVWWDIGLWDAIRPLPQLTSIEICQEDFDDFVKEIDAERKPDIQNTREGKRITLYDDDQTRHDYRILLR